MQENFTNAQKLFSNIIASFCMHRPRLVEPTPSTLVNDSTTTDKYRRIHRGGLLSWYDSGVQCADDDVGRRMALDMCTDNVEIEVARLRKQFDVEAEMAILDRGEVSITSSTDLKDVSELYTDARYLHRGVSVVALSNLLANTAWGFFFAAESRNSCIKVLYPSYPNAGSVLVTPNHLHVPHPPRVDIREEIEVWVARREALKMQPSLYSTNPPSCPISRITSKASTSLIQFRALYIYDQSIMDHVGGEVTDGMNLVGLTGATHTRLTFLKCIFLERDQTLIDTHSNIFLHHVNIINQPIISKRILKRPIRETHNRNNVKAQPSRLEVVERRCSCDTGYIGQIESPPTELSTQPLIEDRATYRTFNTISRNVNEFNVVFDEENVVG
ncbi:hypothetical protein M422DRAFT_780685 [Sphaerobolus stellatus SS14]|uniref:Uncharacterized protein n=1 Tax=Sphaerobolus stellatus (strain SS14) TaxID=990650 RepID=A0A0C9UBU1_SPHS4|nr:hypothetical protein M422DRAFT_780685 [Sphaerobolus stellatus SS14]